MPPDLRPDVDSLRPAAVLVPLVERETGLTVLLTRRTDTLPEHPGQVAFPGGRHEPSDRDLVHTALRETAEEIGLGEEFISIAGFLPPYMTITRYSVTPVVGFVRPGFKLVADPTEVDQIFEVPLEFLLDRSNIRREEREFKGQVVGYYVIDYRDDAAEYRIWGATAAMLVDFIARLDAQA
ncbi:MAG: CoA pyrophosphatase [Gammaproteobacteria bacterium]|nr:CoA pyrophosphatase [Gammaproteobacteria bacterium]